jgi:hypothetical protein
VSAPDRLGRALAWPPDLNGRRLRRQHARHPRAATSLRPADQSGRRLRLPGGPHPGPGPRRDRPPPAPALLARDVACRLTAPGATSWRHPERRSGIRDLRPPGPARTSGAGEWRPIWHT